MGGSSSQQHDRTRDLRGDEGAPPEKSFSPIFRFAALERGRQVGSGRLNRGNQAENDSARNRHEKREVKDAMIQLEIELNRSLAHDFQS